LTTTIDSDAAAAGDAFAGRLAEPLRDETGNTLAPLGTLVHGRIMGVERYKYPTSVQIALALETMEIDGAALPLRAAAKKAGPGSGAQKGSPALREMLPYSPETDAVVIRRSGDRWIVAPGYRTEWVTAAP
jgi:hypothetical protein